ncbi:hypothetical protein [Vulcaniibacterium tengchongense]|uniref:Transmembrane protein n=1 Tax=Vulcaniibacterium tengchongense TaxID=1273429 RepID=A0A3N4VAK4_9GAMM|nr:hypothetical protein [Vulcaniibacterium tengchongense]RPE80036.1 hypothetical protein EDC50_1867 [Vulcaniibacterium tengchongense]
MSPRLALAYAGYLLWLAAGWGDFRRHRRADLPHTSGLRESALHLVQLALVGGALVAALALRPSLALLALLLAAALAHAAVGYLDTRHAFAARTIDPLEQHLHSVLDMAPWIALGLFAAWQWDAAVAQGWGLALRRPALGAPVWLAALAPALLLCVLPALREFAAARAARRRDAGAAG